MAFPTTPFLHSLQAAARPSIFAQAGASIDSGLGLTWNSNGVSGPTNYGADYYNAVKFAADQEAWCTVVTGPGTTAGIEWCMFLLRWDPATGNGYGIEHDIDGGWIYKIAGGAETSLLNQAHSNLAAGDRLGASVIGNTITAWKQAGGTGAWTSLMSTTDATYTGTGYIGLEAHTTTTRLTNFGGGAAGSGQTQRKSSSERTQRASIW